MRIRVKKPETPDEFDRMWALNYRIFSDEIGLHECNAEQRLIDKFHAKNRYRIAVEEDSGAVIGMLAAHTVPPWSATAKFGPAIDELAARAPTAEIRLFAVTPPYRKNTVLSLRLAISMFCELRQEGIRQLLISAVGAQVEFYTHLGFEPVGPAVREGAVELSPMRADLALLLDRYAPVIERLDDVGGRKTEL